MPNKKSSPGTTKGVALMQHIRYTPGMSVSDQLRKAMRATGKSAREIAEGSGVALTVLTRFMLDETEMRTANVDRLAAYLNLRLATDDQPKTKRKGS